MKSKRLVLAVACMVFALPAIGDETGFYAGAGVGQSKVADLGCNNSPGVTFTSCNDTDTGIKVFGGYQFTTHWGAEASYIDFGKIKATAIASGILVNVDAKASGFQFAATGT